MFGTYRLILASFVALSHYGLIFYGLNPGQWSVLAFYMVSGFLMTHQFKKLSPNGSPWKFYLDRFLRIYPLYGAIVIISILVYRVNSSSWMPNLLLLPLNFSYFTGETSVIGPAWSLACEIQFYLLVPILSFLSTKIIRALLLLSLGVFLLSPYVPHSTFWAYIGLPGILFAFLTGILLARNESLGLKRIGGLFIVFLAGFILLKMNYPELPVGIHINVCIGYLLALPCVAFLSRLSPKVKWDQNLGLISYPLFLSHELGRALLQMIGISNILLAFTFSLGLSLLLIFLV